ncbi:MAG TPA: pitrilysin family protein [Thermomicrobiales bacterium]|nr:pitrilysin family protein [Thermomicrobiales bacterium]
MTIRESVQSNATHFYQKTTLENGARVVTSTMEHVHSASITFNYNIGSRYEPDEHAGISHVLEHMLFKGTERRPDPAQISGDIESVGGILNAATGRESTNYWAKTPSTHLEMAFDVLADIVRNSTIPEDELEKERGVIFEEIRGIVDTPDDLVHDIIDEVIWDNQPVGRSIIGTEETVGAISASDLRDYLKRYYRPDRLVIAASGKIDHEQVVALAEHHLGDMEPGGNIEFSPTEQRQTGPRVRLVNRPTEQAHLCLGHPALPYTDERRYTQGMIDAILSSGMSSRLFQEIREKRGLVYSVYGYYRQYVDAGQGVVYAGTDLARIGETIDAILVELNRLRADRVPEDELNRTKELRKGRILMGMEDSRSVAGWIGSQELTFGEILTPDEVMERIDAVRSDDMLELAREIIREDALNLAVVGPYDDIDAFQSMLRFG